MRPVPVLLSWLFLTVVPVAAQEIGATDLMIAFAKAAKEDDFPTLKSLVNKHKAILRWAYMDGENQYFSAVQNNAEADKKERGAAMALMARLANVDLKDGWYADRWSWAEKQDAASAAKLVKVYEIYDRADRVFVKAKAERTGDLWAECAKDFALLDEKSADAKDPLYQFFANWYLAECRLQQFEYFEAVYHAKKALELAKDAKVTTAVEREWNVAGTMKKASLQATPEIDPAKVDIRLPVADAKAKFGGVAKPAEPAKPEGEAGKPAPEGGEKKPDAPKPGPAGKPDPKGAAKDAIPPKPTEHGGKVDWVDADKPKTKEVGERGFLSSFPSANNPPLRWSSVRINPGADTKFLPVPGDNKLLNDKGKFVFDPDADGKAAPEKLKLGAKPEAVKFPKRDLGEGVVGDVTLRIMEQPTSYKMMGFDSKENPERDGAVLLYNCGMSVATKFDGYDVVVYDDNADGFLNSYGDDCVVVSKGAVKRVQPLSKYVYVGDLLYEFALDAAGRNIKLRPYDGPVALLKVDFGAGPSASFLTAKGQGDHAGVAFNLMDARDKWMWVPPGEYTVAHGYFAFGPEGDKRETIQIVPGRAKTFVVKAGEQNVWKLGGADGGYRFQWKAEKKGDTLLVAGKNIEVYGAFGERYEWFLPGVLRPHVKAKIGEKGAPFFDKQMQRIDEGALRVDGGLRWYPKDLEIKLTGKGDVFLQMEEEYPKLGKITSAFAIVN